MNIVKVKFKNNCGELGKSYCFKTTLDDLKKGDIVIVNVIQDDNFALGFVDSYSYNISDYDIANRYVVQRVDLDKFYDMLKIQEEIEKVRTKLKIRSRQLKELASYDDISEIDKDTAILVRKLRELYNIEDKKTIGFGKDEGRKN